MGARSTLREEAVRAAFSRLDADMSGTISAADFKAVMGDSFEGVRVEDLAADLKLNGREEIGFEDFVRVLEDHDVTPSPSARDRRGFAGWHWQDAAPEVAKRIGGA